MLMPQRRNVLLCSCLFVTVTALGTGVVGIAANSATEAPAGNWRWNRPGWSARHCKQVKNCPALGFAYQGPIYA
jgi:hypothetical protein